MIALEHDSTTKPRSSAAGFVSILAAAALAVAPQIVWGDSCGHDFDFHFISWFDSLNAWRHGIAYPHWTASANFGAGEPRFVFYSPLTWMLAAALGAVIPWSIVPAALTFILLAGTGFATRVLARSVMSEGAASLAGCIAIFSGYPLFTAYERSAFAELAGGIWLPLVLLYGLPRSADDWNMEPPQRRLFTGSTVPLALAITGAWLSNPTVGVMACYTLAALTFVVTVTARSMWPAIRNALGALLGLGLSAFYLVPAAWEQRWVDIHEVTEDPGQTLENNWLFARHPDPTLAFHDSVLRTVSFIAVGMVSLTVVALIVCYLRGSGARNQSPHAPRIMNNPIAARFDREFPQDWWLPLACVPFAVLLLQFPLSEPLWNALPDLRFLQFPWRWLLVLEAPMAVFLAAAIWPRKNSTRARATAVIACGIVFLCATAATSRFLYQACYPEDAIPAVLNALTAGEGYAGTSEYEPIGADISLIAQRLPAACFTSDPRVILGRQDADGNLAWSPSQGSCDALYSFISGSTPEHPRISGIAPHSGFLVVRLLRYPAWKLALNGKEIGPGVARPDGLLSIPVSQGAYQFSADWTTTLDVLVARCLSALTLLLLTAIFLFRRKVNKSRLS